jgi:hypothetical protein
MMNIVKTFIKISLIQNRYQVRWNSNMLADLYWKMSIKSRDISIITNELSTRPRRPFFAPVLDGGNGKLHILAL